MTGPIGLVTGSQPFAGLPTNPAAVVLPFVDGMVINGVTIVARETPVSHADLPTLLPALVDEYRPVFVLALGLALGAAVVRAETIGVNACHFAIPDNEGGRPIGGLPIDEAGPAARMATWDAKAIVAAIMAEEIPAKISFHAGTHLCNLTLYTYLGALEARGLMSPCGFLHLPYLPEQIVWMMRQRGDRPDTAPGTPLDLPSMALDTQIRAVKAVLGALARQALGRETDPAQPLATLEDSFS
jgi:pyroglutamyl-peptidase